MSPPMSVCEGYYQQGSGQSVLSLFDPNQAGAEEPLLDHYFVNVIQKLHKDQSVHNKPPSAAQLERSFSSHQIPTAESDYLTYFQNLVQTVVLETTRVGSPLMIGHMTSALPFFHRPLAKLVTALNQNTVKLETASLVTFLEREAIAKLHSALFNPGKEFYERNLHDPQTCLGSVTSGGTLANFTGLWVARNKALGPTGSFPGVEKAGMHRALRHYNYDDAVIIGSQLLHYSFKKTADMLGIGTNGLVGIPYDSNFQVRLDLMEEKIMECKQNNVAILALVGVAGATETGTVDNLQGISSLAQKYGIHFHVDAAWGGPLIFSETYSYQLAGIDLADSITIDGHKQLYTPMGCGLILFRDPHSADAIKKSANYIIRNESMDAGKFSPEGSRPAAAFFLHACLSIIGKRGYQTLIDRNCLTAKAMAEKIRQLGEFEIIAEPTTNIFLYRWIPLQFLGKLRNGSLSPEDNDTINLRNQELQSQICKEGESFVSRTTIFSNKYQMMIVALRVVIANPNTRLEHVEFALREQLKMIHRASQL